MKFKSIIISLMIVFSTVTLASQDYNKHILPNVLDMYSQGSGFFINEQGYIATAAHVVEDAAQVQVLYRNEMRNAKVIAVDSDKDLAIIKLETGVNFKEDMGFPLNLFYDHEWTVPTPYFNVVSSPNPKQTAFIIGFPAISQFGLYPHVTSGKISNMKVYLFPGVFLMDAKACHGNSGGLVTNYEGQAVGMLVLGFGGDGMCSNLTGANYLDGLIDLANKHGVRVHTNTQHTNEPAQKVLYQMIQQVVAQEKVVFIQVRIKSE